ncbi:MAG: MFS transporter [Alistipes sp.]|nr:MFS transporter [Alistipes sp.]
MTETLHRKITRSSAARWTVLLLVSFTMLTGYIISDVMAPLKPMLESGLGWDSTQYGFFTSGYSLFNVFLFMLIFAGMILDRMGPRFTRLLAVLIMIGGTFLKYWAVSTGFGEQVITILGKTMSIQVFYAMLGFAIFGVGIEMIGITASKIIVKWFTGRSLALAMGLNVAAGRIGTAIALLGALPYAERMGSPSAPLVLCLIMLCIGLLSFLIYIMLDRKADRELAADPATASRTDAAEDEKFKITDIFTIVKLRGFWLITLLCVLFYSAVFPFLKFATELMIQKFGVSTTWAGAIPALLPFGNILLTPLFGSIYDKKGRGATLMMIGALLLVFVHLMFSVPGFTSPAMAVCLMIILGAAFSLVPSAMWPSVPKIIPYHKLGTAYSVIFWVQNIGLGGVPLLIGWVLDKYCVIGTTMSESGNHVNVYDYNLPMMIFALFGIMSVLVAYLLKKEDARKGYGLERPNIKNN